MSACLALGSAAPAAWAQEAGSPPAQPPQPVAPPVATGILEVATDVAGAEVLLDDKPVGVTPLRLEAVPAGEHDLAVNLAGREPVRRRVTVQSGGTVRLELAPPALAPPPLAPVAAEAPPPGPSAEEAWREVALSVLNLPWAGLAVGVTFALLLTAAVMFTSTPADLPLFESAGIAIDDQQWRWTAVAALAGGVVTGSVALVLLVVRTTPVEKLVTAVRASTKGSEKQSPR
ncbi:MAG: PEGA domain-containing protein [Myxococcota bacterium]